MLALAEALLELQPLDGLGPIDEVLAITVVHHRQLKIEQLVHGAGDDGGVWKSSLHDDADQLAADDAHAEEHEVLRKIHADMGATDPAALLEVGLVVFAAEELIDPQA